MGIVCCKEGLEEDDPYRKKLYEVTPEEKERMTAEFKPAAQFILDNIGDEHLTKEYLATRNGSYSLKNAPTYKLWRDEQKEQEKARQEAKKNRKSLNLGIMNRRNTSMKNTKKNMT